MKLRAPQRAWLILPPDRVAQIVAHFDLHAEATPPSAGQPRTWRPFIPAPEKTWFAAAVAVGDDHGLLGTPLWEREQHFSGRLHPSRRVPWDWVWVTRDPARAQVYAGIAAAAGGRDARRSWACGQYFEAEYFTDEMIVHYQGVRARVERFHHERGVLCDLAEIE